MDYTTNNAKVQYPNRLAYTAEILKAMESKRAEEDWNNLLARVTEMRQLLDRFPKCEKCGKPLTAAIWEINNEILCDDCAEAAYRHKDMEGYMRNAN